MLKGSDKDTVLRLLRRAAQARRIGDTLSEDARRAMREYADQLEAQARAQADQDQAAQDAGDPMPPPATE